MLTWRLLSRVQLFVVVFLSKKMVEMWQSYSQKLRRKAEKVRINKKEETGGKHFPKNISGAFSQINRFLKRSFLHYLKAETRRGFHLCGI